MKLFKCYTEKDKNKNWTDLSLLGQEPTFKVILSIIKHIFPPRAIVAFINNVLPAMYYIFEELLEQWYRHLVKFFEDSMAVKSLKVILSLFTHLPCPKASPLPHKEAI